MKIAFISQPFGDMNPHHQSSSLEIWTYEVASRLCNYDDCDVIVYAREDDRYPKIEEHKGIQYRRVSLGLDEKTNRLANTTERILSYPRQKLPVFAQQFYYQNYIKQVALDLRDQDCDIAHIFNFSQFAPVIKEHNSNIKVVLNMTCEWLSQLDENVIKRRLQSVDQVISCSNYITHKIQQRFPAYADRCTTVYNGVYIPDSNSTNEERFQSEEENKRLLFVGRVSPEKGVHDLLQAMPKIVEACPDVQLDIVGPTISLAYEYLVMISDDPTVSGLSSFYTKGLVRHDTYFKSLKASLEPDVANRVNFIGQVPHADIMCFYQHADILINPSLSESFGISLIEAMANGRPVVASRVGGMQEILINGETGFFFEPGDADALAEKTITLLKNPDMRKSMGMAGRQRVQELFTWENVTQDLLLQYSRIVDSED